MIIDTRIRSIAIYVLAAITAVGLLETAPLPYVWISLLTSTVCVWSFRHSRRTAAKLIWLNFGVLVENGTRVQRVSRAIPDYIRPRDPRYRIHELDTHPTALVHDKVADYVVREILDYPEERRVQ